MHIGCTCSELILLAQHNHCFINFKYILLCFCLISSSGDDVAGFEVRSASSGDIEMEKCKVMDGQSTGECKSPCKKKRQLRSIMVSVMLKFSLETLLIINLLCIYNYSQHLALHRTVGGNVLKGLQCSCIGSSQHLCCASILI